jgi:hypothetical protein
MLRVIWQCKKNPNLVQVFSFFLFSYFCKHYQTTFSTEIRSVVHEELGFDIKPELELKVFFFPICIVFLGTFKLLSVPRIAWW